MVMPNIRKALALTIHKNKAKQKEAGENETCSPASQLILGAFSTSLFLVIVIEIRIPAVFCGMAGLTDGIRALPR